MREHADFIAGLPKAELHVHHVGSARPETVAELAARHPDAGVPQDIELLRDFYTFTDFGHFIDVYLAVVSLLRTPEDIRLLTYEVIEGLAKQNVRYAEITMTPFTSVRMGIPIEAYTEAIEDARRAAERDFGTVARWIYDIPGEAGLASADATVGYAVGHGPQSLVAFGLGGPEIGVPRAQFAPHFAKARAAGLRSVPHAGESTGPESVWSAIHDLGAERIGHGIAAAQDPVLMDYLATHRIPLEVSPTSNLATRVVERLQDHPIARLREAGVIVTVNSDDPPMFGTTLNREYAIAAELLDLDARGLAGLATTAVDASFAPPEVRTRLREEIATYTRASLG